MNNPESIEAWAAAEVAAAQPAKAPKGISEADIAEKMAAGLPRENAIIALVNQAEHDAENAPKPAKAKAK